MKRILFVDDDQYVLDALRNILRKQRNEWDMVFALGGNAALAEMEKAPFDVVVSDMRMSDMDGAALLGEVRDAFPGTARIVLSGHSEHEAVVRALPVMHQFLNKPCSTEALRGVIQRTCALQELLHEDTIRNLVGKLDRLPSPPAIYMQLTQALADPKVNSDRIAAIVEADPAMSAKLLQLVNSAYFGLAQRATSIHQAVTYLGIEVLKALALSTHVFSTVDGSAPNGRLLDQFQKASLATATVAKQMVRDRKKADDAFTAGIVHDIGRIVIAVSLPERFREIEASAKATGKSIVAVEREMFGVSHAEIGAYLLGVWGVPFSITETVAFHHTPGAVSDGNVEVLAAVHVAGAIVDGARVDATPPSEAFDRPFLERIGLVAELPRWQAAVDRYFGKVEERSEGKGAGLRAPG
ncbi:MAG TPA: response regulator [Polyangiaceae bacterium]